MYLILVKYFYYFYYLKKDKKFKFFILVDLMFYLMKRYFYLLKMKKRFGKKKKFFVKELDRMKEYPIKWTKIYSLNLDYYSKRHHLITEQLNKFNDFIIEFMPTQLVPLGNRKKFYNLINKKYKRFFLLLKKKLNKKFVFHYLILMFRKLKDLFIKSDPITSKEKFIYELFSTLIFESKYSSLLQTYKQQNKNENMNKNKLMSFFNLISFFLYRIDFFLLKTLSYISLSDIRMMIFEGQVVINNLPVSTMYYRLNKYDLVELPNRILSRNKRFYVFALQLHFTLINNYPHIKVLQELKHRYYVELSKKINKSNANSLYLKQIKKSVIRMKMNSYVDLIDQVHNFFFNLKDRKYNSFYTFDTLNNYKESYNIEYEFPFYLKKRRLNLFLYTSSVLLGNISFTLSNKEKNTSIQKNIKNGIPLINYIDMYNYFYKFKQLYYYTHANRIIVSPMLIEKVSVEQRKLIYYYSLFFNVNLLEVI